MEFCMSLATKAMQQNLEKEKNKNIGTSPISLNIILNMVAAGTKGCSMEQLLGARSSTNVEELSLASSKMLALFGSEIIDKVGPTMSIANGVWVDRTNPMKPSYQNIMHEVYEANAQTVDFVRKRNQVIKEINSWAEKATRGLIRNMLTRNDVPRDSSLILGNAFYFKGNWEIAFKKSKTSDERFYLYNGETIEVPFMKMDYGEHYYGSFDDFQLLKLPYKCGEGKLCDEKRFSMFVFLPLKNKGLENLIQKLHDDPLLYRHCDGLKKKTLSKLWLPKFKFMYKIEPLDIIKEMGIDLRSMPVNDITETVVNVSTMIQQSCVEVNEEGTETAAVISCRVGQIAARRSPRGSEPLPSFVADNPFVFMIREEVSGIVVFTGAVLNPLKEGEKDEKPVFKKKRTV